MVGVDLNMASHVLRLVMYAALFITSRCTRLTVYSHLTVTILHGYPGTCMKTSNEILGATNSRIFFFKF